MTYLEQYNEALLQGKFTATAITKAYIAFLVNEIKSGRATVNVKRRDEVIEEAENKIGRELTLYEKAYIEEKVLS